jgi:excinuclease UvrABC nuclease subunit
VIVPPPHRLAPREQDVLAATAALPAASGIYAVFAGGAAPHLSWSVNLKRRLSRLLAGQYRGQIDAIEYWPAGSRLEIFLLLYELTRSYYPGDYRKRLRLRLPWFVSLRDRDPFPRLEVLNRIPRNSGHVFGPFANRELAQRYEQEVLGLFQIRRCSDTLAPRADHPGCIYGEMSQCLRPCQCAVTADEYASEVHRVADFLASNGKTPASALGAAREKASADLDFEQAAQIHKRLEKVTAAAGCRDDVISSVDRFSGVALTKGVNKLHLRLWPIAQGYWQDPITVDVSRSFETKPLDHLVRELLESSLVAVSTQGARAEHLAIFSRWYYSSWRDGHWFSYRALADLNYRRLVREISSMAKAETLNVLA